MEERVQVTTDQAKMDVALIHRFISASYWAKGIPLQTLKTAMENSLCFAVLNNKNEQIAFSRVISDFATFAYLADVFVVPEYQKKGLSKLMLKAIQNHTKLQGLRRNLLVTADAHGLYEQYGYKPLAKPDNFMEIWQPNIYQ